LDQASHLRRAGSTKRCAFNWGLAEWQRMHKVGEKPSMTIIKRRLRRPRQVSSITREEFLVRGMFGTPMAETSMAETYMAEIRARRKRAFLAD
jgi:hypothetical protein